MDRVVTALIQARNDGDTYSNMTTVVTQSREKYLKIL